MKRASVLFWVGLASLALFVAGCVGPFSPSRRAVRAQQATQNAKKVEQKLDESRDNVGRAYVHGADLALRQAPQGPAVDLASGLVRRAGLTLGPPSMEDARTIAGVVDGALAAEIEKRQRAERELAALDARVVGLEKQLTDARERTETAQQKQGDLSVEFSGLAERFLRARRWVVLVVLAFAAVLVLPYVLRIAALFAGGPVGGALASVAGWYASKVTASVPGALSKAGAVAAEEHRRVLRTLESVVVAVERHKQKAAAEEKGALKTILLDETDRDTERPVIEDILARNATRIH